MPRGLRSLQTCFAVWVCYQRDTLRQDGDLHTSEPQQLLLLPLLNIPLMVWGVRHAANIAAQLLLVPVLPCCRKEITRLGCHFRRSSLLAVRLQTFPRPSSPSEPSMRPCLPRRGPIPCSSQRLSAATPSAPVSTSLPVAAAAATAAATT